MALKTTKAAPRRGRGASGRSFAGQRNDRKNTAARPDVQPQLGAVTVYDGRDFRGTVLPQAGRWVAFDASGHRIGTFELRHRAEHALFKAGGPDGAA